MRDPPTVVPSARYIKTADDFEAPKPVRQTVRAHVLVEPSWGETAFARALGPECVIGKKPNQITSPEIRSNIKFRFEHDPIPGKTPLPQLALPERSSWQLDSHNAAHE